MKILITIVLMILINTVSFAATEEGGFGVSGVEEDLVGITDLGNGLIQMCVQTNDESISCVITEDYEFITLD